MSMPKGLHLLGTQQAYKVGVSHRNISIDNIVIATDNDTQETLGVLIDWDISLHLEQANTYARYMEGAVSPCKIRIQTVFLRTLLQDTWAFTSTKLLRPPLSGTPAIHSLADDMESFFWVLVYHVLRYTEHDDGPESLCRLLRRLFYDFSPRKGGAIIGGREKYSILLSCALGEVI